MSTDYAAAFVPGGAHLHAVELTQGRRDQLVSLDGQRIIPRVYGPTVCGAQRTGQLRLVDARPHEQQTSVGGWNLRTFWRAPAGTCPACAKMTPPTHLKES